MSGARETKPAAEPAAERLCLICATNPRRPGMPTCGAKCQKRWAAFMGRKYPVLHPGQFVGRGL